MILFANRAPLLRAIQYLKPTQAICPQQQKDREFSMSLSSSQVRTQLFPPSFMYNNIHIPLNADLRKKGAISKLSVQSLYLHSPNVGVSQDLTLSRQFSHRPNVINGCHLRGTGWGWKRKEKVIQRRLLLTKRCTGCTKLGAARILPPLAVAVWRKMKTSMSLSKFECSQRNATFKWDVGKSVQVAISSLYVGNVCKVH